jgi:hypothetical protein
MTEHQSSRTLVKSAPELWAECSDAASLARHLGAFGEIRITKLEPETAVAWEGTAASGTVKLESSGWGTRVTLTVKEEAPPRKAGPEAVEPAPEPVAPEPEPVAVEPEPEQVAVEAEPEPVEPEPAPVAPELVAPAPRAGMFARFRLAFRRKPAAAEPAIEAPPEPEPVALAAPDPEPLAAPGPEPLAAPDLEPIAEPERPPLTGEEALVAALDSLGRAHHRPYSRA